MTSLSKPGLTPWLWVSAGWLLAAVPSLVGALRLLQWAGIQPAPLPVASGSIMAFVLGAHLLGVIAFGLLVPFQLSSLSRHAQARLHRRLGWVLWFSGIAAAATGMVLSLFYPHGPLDGNALLVIRLLAGGWMLWSLGQGLRAILRRRFDQHRAWMIRAYAIGLGAGTQVMTHLPMLIWPPLASETGRTLCMAAGWLVNMALAEGVIRPRRRPAPAASSRP